jgi:ribosomal protein S18 acetylase RimI-like enzyme
LRLLHQGELEPEGIFVARQDGALLGAMVCQAVPGASGLVWPPQARAGAQSCSVEDQLMQHAGAWLRQRGVRIGQSLLAADEVHLGAPLERNGFPHVTRLWYLRHDLNLTYDYLCQPNRLAYLSFAECPSDRFVETLLRSYEESLDCPEVNGARSIHDIIEGHRVQGKHDPQRWWLAQDGQRPVGVLLLTEMPEWEAWDVGYVGVVPEARRHGWGRELMHKALCTAHASEAAQVTLSVDARNRPAWKLYLELGFEPYDHREVHLAIWKGAAARP